MKNNAIITSFAILVTMLFISSTIILDSNTGTVGDIKYSILPPGEFKELNGSGWRLVNGDNINETYLFEFLSDRNLETILWKDPSRDNKHEMLPNLNDKFIRSMGDKTRIVGSPQEDATKLPNSPFSGRTDNGGAHRHSFKKGTFKKDPNGRKWQLGHSFQGRIRNVNTSTTPDHGHTFTVTNGGDSETRPKNIAFYTYIKVEE